MQCTSTVSAEGLPNFSVSKASVQHLVLTRNITSFNGFMNGPKQKILKISLQQTIPEAVNFHSVQTWEPSEIRICY